MSPPPLPKTHRGWWSRNWKWVIPVLLGGLTIMSALVVGGISAVFATLRSSPVYQTAVAKAKADPRVVAALGSPISDRFVFTGYISVNNGYGKANLAVPLQGPRNTAVLIAAAEKRPDADWEYSMLFVQVGRNGQMIDLRQDVGEAAPTQPNAP